MTFVNIRKKSGLTCKEFSERLKDAYPAITGAAVSLAERSPISGVDYTDDCKRLIKGRFLGVKPKDRREGQTHTSVWLPNSVSDMAARLKAHYNLNLRGLLCRLIEEDYYRLFIEED